ncbi:MAG TPA: 2-amino-4-hydroxy-6-hydroxymethyldihydropteridine diphosphokinase [Planctomycetaceae bacterium]|jgi:2-amino-4-hydroxy-6-hydroxymethyldihydropteridine diphosphokinase
MPRCYISLGGNSGQVAATFEQALGRLESDGDCRVLTVSECHKTAPVGDQAGTGFLNAAAELETSLDPLDLLDRLQAVERELGRTRTVHWGPRTLDLDLLFWESQIINSPRLVVPHPAAWYRRFVLDPLVEIAPRFVHPVKRVDMTTLRGRLLVRPFRVSLAGGAFENKSELVRRLSADFPDVVFSDWDSSTGSEPALIFWLGPPVGSTGNESSATGSPAGAANEFERLPAVPRIDATTTSQPIHDFIRYVIQAAQG